MDIIVEPRLSYYTQDIVDKILQHYPDSKFVMESALLTRNGWSLDTCLVFYTKNKHPEGSNYMGVMVNDLGSVIVFNAIRCTEPMSAFLTPSGKVVYSIHRHDFQTDEETGAFIDGGRDYTRIGGAESLLIKLGVISVEADKLIFKTTKEQTDV
jgi:hypothetical protein